LIIFCFIDCTSQNIYIPILLYIFKVSKLRKITVFLSKNINLFLKIFTKFNFKFDNLQYQGVIVIIFLILRKVIINL